jgi:hypothetical protein
MWRFRRVRLPDRLPLVPLPSPHPPVPSPARISRRPQQPQDRLARPLRHSPTKRARSTNQSSLPPPATSSVCSSALAPPGSAFAETPWTRPCGIPAALPKMPDRSHSTTLPLLRPSLKLRAGSAFTASILAVRQPAITHPTLAAQEVAWAYRQRGSSLPWHRDRQRAPPHWQPQRLLPGNPSLPQLPAL